MTFDASILHDQCLPKRSFISKINGESYTVTGAGRVDLTSSLSLEHTLLIPSLSLSLSNNLLSVLQVTSQLNCLVLIYPNFCLLQNIRTFVFSQSHRVSYPPGYLPIKKAQGIEFPL